MPKTGPNTKPGEKPPVMPLEATQHTARGAKAFAEFFIKTIDWGFATVSGTYTRHFSTSECTGCAAFYRGFDKARKQHDRYIGGRITVTRAHTTKPQTHGAETTVVITFNIESFVENNRHGKFKTGDDAHDGERFNVSLTWTNSWRVRQLTVDS